MNLDQFKNHNYRIINKEEDWKDTIIEKDNITAKFSIRDLEANVERIEKIIKEVEAKFKHEQVVKENIEQHHPWIKDMDAQKIYTCWMYQEALEVIKQYEPRLEEIKKAKDEDVAQLRYVILTLGSELNIPTDAGKEE